MHLHRDRGVHLIFELLVDLGPITHSLCLWLAPKLAQGVEVLQLTPRWRHEVCNRQWLLGLGAETLEGRARVILSGRYCFSCRHQRLLRLRGRGHQMVPGEFLGVQRGGGLFEGN